MALRRAPLPAHAQSEFDTALTPID